MSNEKHIKQREEYCHLPGILPYLRHEMTEDCGAFRLDLLDRLYVGPIDRLIYAVLEIIGVAVENAFNPVIQGALDLEA